MIRNFVQSIRMIQAIFKVRFSKKPRILSAQIILNYTCNLHCVYCFSLPVNEVMEFDRVKDILLLFKRAGILQVSFSGGEPTIHPYYQEIIRLSKKLGFYIIVATNGIRRDLILPADKEAIPHFVSVSLDGPEEIHDLYRGEGVYERAAATLESLKERKIPRAIHAVIGKHNCSLENVEWFFSKAEELNANCSFQLMLPRFDSKNQENPFAPGMKQIKALIEGILNMPFNKRRRFVFGEDVLTQFMTWDSLVPYYRIVEGKQCFAGRNFAFVSPSYLMAPCPLLGEHPWYRTNNIFLKSFDECLKGIKKIPCNDCYLGCNILRNNIIALNPRICFNALKILFRG